jgi:hypothetical protein
MLGLPQGPVCSSIWKTVSSIERIVSYGPSPSLFCLDKANGLPFLHWIEIGLSPVLHCRESISTSSSRCARMRRAMRGAGICDGAVGPALKGGPSDPILEPRLSEWLLWSVGRSPARGYAPGIACLHSFGMRLRWAGGLAIRACRNASHKRGVPGLLFASKAWFLESNDLSFQGGHEPNCPPLLAPSGGAVPEMGAAAMEGGTRARASLGAPRCRVRAGMRGLQSSCGRCSENWDSGHPERRAIGPESRGPRLRCAPLGLNGHRIRMQTSPLRHSRHLPRCRRALARTHGLDDDPGSARSRPSRASVLPGAGSGALRIRSSPVGPRREAGFVEASREANGALLGDGIRRTG